MIQCERIVEVPLSAVPKPYIIHKTQGKQYEVRFECTYADKMDNLMAAMKRVHDIHSKIGTPTYTKYELDVDGFFQDLRGNLVFD